MPILCRFLEALRTGTQFHADDGIRWRAFAGGATVDLVADQRDLTLFHCHIQQHMDFGFMALFRYV
jgi:hypothetical protein